MPIHPENKARYPREWPAISRRIRFERAGGRCECEGECGHDHGGRCGAIHGEPHPVTGSKVILTTGHINHTPEDCRDENLRGWCQKCHLSHDRPHHISERKKRAAKKKLKAKERVRQVASLMAFEIECKTGKRVAR